MKIDEKKVFRSRISVLIVGFTLAVFLPCFILVFQNKLLLEMCILGAAFILVLFILSGNRYIISEDKLQMKIWMIPVGAVEISQIVSVKRSYNPISSPATSLKRLKFDFKKGTKFWLSFVSPVREQEFIEELQAINPEIDLQVSDKEGSCQVLNWDI